MGLLHAIYRFFDQCYPPTSKFDPDKDIPDLTGKVVIVTGGNSGTGKATVKALLVKNAKVYMASRSRARAEAAIDDLKRTTGKEAIFLELDLADLDKVTRAAQEFKSKETDLHILFNSGGVMIPPIDQLTKDGYDLTFGTNVLGHAHFTLSLIPELEAGACSSPDGKARVVNTSSLVTYHNPAGLIKWNTLCDGPERKAMGPEALYSQSKFGTCAFSNELAKRYAEHGISSNAVNPGNTKSELQRYMTPLQHWIVDHLFLYPTEFGALTQLYVGTSASTVNVNGGWFIPWARSYHHEIETHNPETEEKLWEWIEEQRKGH